MPNPLTVMGFYQVLLKALGAPISIGKKMIGNVRRQAFTLIERNKVEMIILDEMDYIVNERAVRCDDTMLEIKNFLNSARVSIVIVGTEADLNRET